MAYIPNFFEQNQENIQKAMQSVAQGIAPDYYAQQTFQQMAQQNPGLIPEIANWDDSQRETFNKNVLKSKNKNPLASIGIGPQRKAREDKEKVLSLLTPGELQSQRAKEYNYIPQSDLDRTKVVQNQQDAAAAQNLDLGAQQFELGGQNIELNKAKLKDLQDSRKALDDAILKYPTLKGINIGQVAKEAVYGQGDPDLIKVIQKDQGANELFENAKKQVTNEIAAKYSMAELMQRERNTRDRPKKEQIGAEMQILGQSLNESQQELSRATAAITQAVEGNSMLRAYLRADPKERKDIPISQETLDDYQNLLKAKADKEHDVEKFYTAKNSAADELDRVKAADQKIQEKVATSPAPNLKAQKAADAIAGGASLESFLNNPLVPETDKTWLRAKFGAKK